MTHLVLSSLVDGDNIFSSFGMWAFLSVGAVSLFGVFLPITTWLEARRKEREAYYRAESLRRVSEASTDGARASMEYMREQSRITHLKTVEGVKMGGLITTAIGIGTIVLLWVQVGPKLATSGLVPLLVGLAMLMYVYFLAGPPE